MYTFALIWAWLAALGICMAAWPKATRNFVIAIGCWLLIFGCATHTPEDREYRRQVDRMNWELCAQVYSNAGEPTYHSGHTHTVPLTPNMEAQYIRQDLALNNCRNILKHYWSEY